jgi:HAE1 family hydrophobic/amphiphilic exporter-1
VWPEKIEKMMDTRDDTKTGQGLVARSIARPVTVAVGVILVVFFGALSLTNIPIQLAPDIQRPVLSVTTRWPGAGPTEVEADILEPQEDALKTLPGLTRLTANAGLGQGTVTLELEVGTDLDEALVRASNLLSQVPSYPENVDNPVIRTADASGPPIVVALVQSQGEKSAAEYRTWVNEEILPIFQRIPGVASISHFGGQDTEVQILFSPEQLAARGLSLRRVAQAIRSELRDLSGGDMNLGKRRMLVRTLVAPDKPVDFENLVVATTREGAPVRLGDVAVVRHGLRKPGSRVFGNGKESLALLFFREAGTNVLQVTEEVRKTAQALQESQFGPKGLSLTVVSDQSAYIYSALDLVRQNLLVGAFLAIVVLLLFLRSLAAALVVSVAIPVCVIGTALGMSLFGRTVNVVSLAGMAFAVGMVVDNALVVLENIDTWRMKESDVRRAALRGALEVWGAILASTLTTAAVFIPIIGWQDEVGELLRDLAVALSVAVLVSLVVSVLVIPSFSARMLKVRDPATLPLQALARKGEAFRQWVGQKAEVLSTSWWKALATVVAALGGATLLAVLLMPPMEYLPTGNRNLIFGIMIPPPGYSVDEMSRVGERIQAQLLPHLDEDKDGVPAIRRYFFAGSPERAFMGSVAKDERRARDLLKYMRRVVNSEPGAFGIATQASLFGRGLGGGRSIDLEVGGADLRTITGLAGQMMGRVREALPKAQVRPNPSLDLGAPEIQVRPRRDQLARYGISGADLGFFADALVDGAIVGEYAREGQPKLDVVLTPRGGPLDDPARLASAPVAVGGSAQNDPMVPLGSLATLEEELGPTVLARIERRRAITLTIAPPDEIALEDAINLVRNDVVNAMRDEGAIPDDIRITLSGAAGDLEVAQKRFGYVLLLALLISFLLLAALFEDFIAPLPVLVTIPLAAAGGLLGLRLVDTFLGQQPLDMMTAVGFVILIGVVVNNAILVVDGALNRLRMGSALESAVSEAVKSRVRPIFMSTLTSLAGLTPMVVFPGSGSELYRGVGAVVLGGLALSTVLTLFVVPALFSLIWRLRLGRIPTSQG